MKFQAGAKFPVVRQDSKSRRLKKLVCDLPVLPGMKARCTPSSVLSNVIIRASPKSFLIILTVLLLGLIALLQMSSVSTGGQIVTRVSIVALKVSFVTGRQWRRLVGVVSGRNPNKYAYEGYIPPFVLNSTDCLPESSEMAGFVLPGSIKSSHPTKLNYDVCLAVSIGDDGDRPNSRALQYPLVSRLTDALKYEAILAQKEFSRDVKVLVGVDYGAILCLIVRDTFAELAGVSAQCMTFAELEQGTECGKLLAGSSKRFVPQVPDKWTEAVQWQSGHLVDLDCADPSHQPPALPEKDWQPTIVTGFSSNHMTVGLLLLRSIGKAVKDGGGLFNVSVVVWALEQFDKQHSTLLNCVMDELSHEYGVKVEVRLFDWSAYPSWMRINQNLGYFGGTGEYAWKAVMVHTVLRERGMVIWSDAGDRFRTSESLVETLKVLNVTGFVSGKSRGYVYTRTHPLVLKYFRVNTPGIWDRDNCEAAMVGFTLKKYTELARPWYDCSLIRQCIAPDGSDRSNHRQDQAALTILSVLTKNSCKGTHPDFRHHADDDPTFGKLVTGTYLTKCYVDPLFLNDQGTLDPEDRPHGIIN